MSPNTIQNDLPSNLDVDQFELDKKAASILARVYGAEENKARAIQELADKMKKGVIELNEYLSVSQEISRNYIQLVNRNSDIVKSNDLQKLKDHIKRIEATITAQTEAYNVMYSLAKAQSEFANSIKEYDKHWDNLVKKESIWQDADYELKKAQSKENYDKYDKIEQNIKKGKVEVIKAFNEKNAKDNLVSTNMVRLNQVWNELKAKIKNIQW